MKSFRRSLIILGIVLAFPASIHAATYYVSTTGNDSNPGTLTQPWRNIQKAANTMVAGDTVYIHSGTYNEKVTPTQSGTAAAYITYRNYGDGEVIIDGQASRDNCIYVANKSYLQFINLRLTNTGYGGMKAPFAAYAGAHHLILDGLITEKGRFGILLQGNKTSSEDPSVSVGFVTVRNSIVRNNAAYGVFVYYKVTDTVIGPNNIIYNENSTNGVPVDDQYGIDIDTDYPGDPANGPRRITIIGNEIYGHRIQGIRPWNGMYILIKDNYIHHNGATGIQVEDGCQYVVVDGNRTEYNNQGYEWETGIWIDGTAHALVQNNLIRGNQIGLMTSSSNDVLIRNNIIYESNRAISGSNMMGTVIYSGSSRVTYLHNTLWRNGISGSRGNLMYCSNSATDTILKNNIFTESTGSYDGWINCPITSDYNNFYSSGTLSMYYGGSNRSWSSYISASGQDTHSITVNPQLVNPTGGNFALSSSSPDIDSGDFLARTLSAGSGTVIPVTDARYFSDGFKVVSGDTIRVGSQTVQIRTIDYSANALTVDRSISWNTQTLVSLPYSGNAPDRGASEYGGIGPTQIPLTPTPPTSTPGGVPGDANGDGHVDGIDYVVWLNHYATQSPNGPSDGDFNRDGKVDGIDYVVWLNNYGE